MISMTISLQASRSLVSPHSSLSVQFVMALMSSSHRARGLPLFLAPPPIPNIIDQVRYNSSNVGGVTAGQVGHNSSNYKSI